LKLLVILKTVTCLHFSAERSTVDDHASPNISLEFLQASQGQYFSLKNEGKMIYYGWLLYSIIYCIPAMH
jgi:hypothetical protein